MITQWGNQRLTDVVMSNDRSNIKYVNVLIKLIVKVKLKAYSPIQTRQTNLTTNTLSISSFCLTASLISGSNWYHRCEPRCGRIGFILSQPRSPMNCRIYVLSSLEPIYKRVRCREARTHAHTWRRVQHDRHNCEYSLTIKRAHLSEYYFEWRLMKVLYTTRALKTWGSVTLHGTMWAATWQNQQSDCARPAKTQISLGIRPDWSESSLCAQWVAKDPSFLRWAHSHFVGFVMSRLMWNC